MQFRALPSEPDREDSDAARLVELCLARLREEAALDDSELPPLRLITEQLASTTPQRPVTPSAFASLPLLAPPEIEIDVELEEPPPRARKRRRWPVLLGVFLVGAFAGAALMASPLGRRAEVQHGAKVVRAHVAEAIRSLALELGPTPP